MIRNRTHANGSIVTALCVFIDVFFPPLKFPCLVCWASHQYLQRLMFTVLEDAEWLQNKSNKSLTKSSTAGGPGRSTWQGRHMLSSFAFLGLWVAPKQGKAGCSGASPPQFPPQPSHSQSPFRPYPRRGTLSYVLPARTSPDQGFALRNGVYL